VNSPPAQGGDPAGSMVEVQGLADRFTSTIRRTLPMHRERAKVASPVIRSLSTWRIGSERHRNSFFIPVDRFRRLAGTTTRFRPEHGPHEKIRFISCRDLSD